jgi:hypothetical protein
MAEKKAGIWRTPSCVAAPQGGNGNGFVTIASFRVRIRCFTAWRALVRMIENKISSLEMVIEIPVNGKTLALRIGRSPGYVAAMKSAGYRFTHGTRTLVSDALTWLAEHPDFRATGYRRNLPGFVKRHRPQS